MITHGTRLALSVMTPMERKLHLAWKSMRNRCSNPGCTGYKHYGGRGIKVCSAWVESFHTFVADIGPAPTMDHEIDRRDTNGDYTPENCRWITHAENMSNVRNNRWVTIEGVTKTLSQWADENGIDRPTLHVRLGLGWEGSKLLSPIRTKMRVTLNGVTKTADDWAKQIGISGAGFRARLRAGDTGEYLLRPGNIRS